MENTRLQTQKLALLALLTAIVAVLQMMGIAIRFGVFAVSLVGVPIIIGGALAAAVAYPVVNTGVFFLGCLLFFMEDCIQFAANLGITGSGPAVIMSVFIGFNFFFELGLDLVLCPVIVRILKARQPFAVPVRIVKDEDAL